MDYFYLIKRAINNNGSRLVVLVFKIIDWKIKIIAAGLFGASVK